MPKAVNLLLLLVLFPFLVHAQAGVSGRVYDARTGDPVPFATIRFGNTGQGMVAGLDGRFELPAGIPAPAFLEISCLGYQTQKTSSISGPVNIYLHADEKTLGEVAVTPPYDKMRRIINNAIANKHRNNPEKYDWYRCHVYYKMIIDASLPDSILNDTSKDGREIKAFFDKQHLLMSETYSRRTWRSPQQLQEDVLASRFSGLKKSVFTSLVTAVVPFHAYNDYITLNGKDYHNPVSRGFEQYYKFNLADELIQDGDTVWVLSFTPKGHGASDLKGKVYINSAGYAISQIVARASDTMLRLNARIEQQYDKLLGADSQYRWFPRQLNYIIEWQQKMDKKEYMTFRMKGNSLIDSVSFTDDPAFRFDKAHTVRLQDKANERSDSAWTTLRPDALTAKEAETYHFIDSIGERFHADRYMAYLSKIPEGKIPIGPVDMDLKRLMTFNKYERSRLGLGLQTNERILRWGSVGGWAGYGFGDKQWKYGVFGEVYLDRYKEFVIRAGYSDDLNEPGRIHINRDLDKTYLKYLLLNRIDQTKAYTLSVKKRLGYWNVELSGGRQEFIPKYTYVFTHKGIDHLTYSASEASLSFRYAYAERTAPLFGYYTRTGTRYPIWYGKVTTGSLEGAHNMQILYTQALTAIQWHKHINRLGMERILIEAGKSWSDAPLPLSKAFAGNGFKYDAKTNITLYSFGGLMTMYPYEYYTDQFVNVILRHDFDWKLYKLESRQIPYGSSPNICLQYNMLWGTLNDPGAQRYVDFSIPDKGYHEVGLLLNSLFRLRYLDLYYLTLNAGYFYHLTDGPFDDKKNGRFVFGLGVEL